MTQKVIMHTPTEKEFLALTKKGNLIPIYKEISGDLETPVSAYYKVASKSPYSFLLESVEGEEKVARFSFLSYQPELILETKNNDVKITTLTGKKTKEEKFKIKTSPLEAIRDILKEYKFVEVKGLPRFCGGLVGFLSYDIVRFFEKLPKLTRDDLDLPDVLMALTKNIIIFDHLNHKIKIVCCVYIEDKSSTAEKIKAYQRALKTITATTSLLNKPLNAPNPPQKTKRSNLKVTSNFNEQQFSSIVDRAKEYIQKGDIIQIVLSQRFQVDLKANPFYIYRSLRGLNPSPYMYFLNFKDIYIVGSSPEMLVRCEDGKVETRPIAGTRKRGANEEEDARLAVDLLQDPKERAEHIMLVDLGRNDLGRVCERGSVRVKDFMIIEKYSHVMHIVSSVVGKLQKDKDHLDVLTAAFPAGTVSGAPKIRAMEIIEELEKVSRGPYAGCIGYLSFSGNLDTCITIRTIVVKGKKAYIQAGAGIVADSVAKTEFQETVNKAKAQIRAIEIAEGSLDPSSY